MLGKHDLLIGERTKGTGRVRSELVLGLAFWFALHRARAQGSAVWCGGRQNPPISTAVYSRQAGVYLTPPLGKIPAAETSPPRQPKTKDLVCLQTEEARP
jgi:hypothetical protein